MKMKKIQIRSQTCQLPPMLESINLDVLFKLNEPAKYDVTNC